jgi:hypothetical protein
MSASRRRVHLWKLPAVIGLVAGATAARAQCKVPANSNEAKLLAYYAVPLAFSPSGSLEVVPAGGVRVGFDLTLIPKPGDDLRRTSRCFQPKEENTQLSPVVPRPRLTIGLPAGFVLEGMYLPPITVRDATPNMASAALAFVRALTPTLGFALRGHVTFGHVQGPITCPVSLLQMSDANVACYGREPSDDTYWPNVRGLEGALTWHRGQRLGVYAGGGWSSLRPRFKVGFQEGDGYYDSTRVETDLSRFAAMGGIRYLVTGRGFAMAEVYSVPVDATVFRAGASLRVR